MIGMQFGGFAVVLIAGLIAAIVLHYLAGYRCRKGFDGFVAQWIVGWLGEWIGSPGLGHWWVKIQDIYVIPSLLGAFAAVFILTADWKACLQVCTPKPS